MTRPVCGSHEASDELVQTQLEKLVFDAGATRMLHGRQWVLDNCERTEGSDKAVQKGPWEGRRRGEERGTHRTRPRG